MNRSEAGGLFDPATDREAPASRLPPNRSRLLLVAVGFLVLGQAVFSRDLDHDLPLGALSASLEAVFPNSETALLAIVLLLVGGAFLAFAWRTSDPVAPKALEEADGSLPAGVVFERPGILLLVIAALIFGTLTLLLLSGRWERWYLGLFLAVLALLAAFCYRQDRLRGAGLHLHVSPVEAIAVALIVAVFAVLNLRDLDGWYYSAIGDEYAFYNLARDIAGGHDANLFSAEDGVYRQHPVASSAYQALFLKLFGPSNFAWKLAGFVSVVAALPLLFLLVRELFDRTVALIAMAMFASSHYVFAYVHVGYNSILTLFPTVAALTCFVLGVRRGSSLLTLLAGIFAGMGFYSFFSARATIAVMALWFLTLRSWPRRWATSLPVSLGFSVTVVPLFAVSRLYVIEEMLRQSAVSYNASIVGESRWQRLLENLPRTGFGFNYSEASLHFVSGSLADVVMAPLFIAGAVFAFSRLSDWRYRFLAFWLIVGFVASGLFSPYPQVPVSRMLYLVPVLATLAALALAALMRGVSAPLPPGHRLPLQAATVCLILALVLALNVRRFWWETPRQIPTTMESVAVRAVLSPACSDGEGLRFVIGEKPEPLFKPAIESYRLGSRAPVLVQWDQLQPALNVRGADVRCAVIMGSAADRRRVEEVLRLAWPDKVAEVVTDRSGQTRVTVLRSSGQAANNQGR